METNEQRRRALSRGLEEELESFLEQVSQIAEGEMEQLEEQVVKSSQAMGRKLMEGILSSRLQDQRPAARRKGRCGHVQRLVGERAKELITLVGPVHFVRPYYQCLQVHAPAEETGCTHGQAPADERWGVEQQRTTPGVQRLISYLSARAPYEEAAQTMSRCVPLGMSGRQALSLMHPVGEALAASEDRRVALLQVQAKQAHRQPAERVPERKIARLYIELDGVLARMRRGSVPMKPEEEQRPGDVYREIKAGAVFRAQRGRHRSDLAPDVYVDTPEPGSLHYVARRTGKGGFGWLLYQLALDGGLEHAQQVVVVGDGAPWIWNLAADHFPHAVQIVDLYHAKAHVWDVAHAVFKRGSPTGTRWAERSCTLLEHGQIAELVTVIATLPPIAPEPGQSRSLPARAVDYFTINAARMRYPVFRAQGMHIGSGIAEAACKTIVSTRAKRSGMRWTPAGLDALLPLRTAVLNDTFDQFWEDDFAA